MQAAARPCVLWPARSWFTIGGSVARAYRTPDFNELYSDGPHLAANSYDVGDPRLRKETGVGLDAFVRLRGERLQAEVSAFRNSLADYIYLRNTGVVGRQVNTLRRLGVSDTPVVR